MKDVTEMTAVEQVCWLADRDGGRVDMDRPRSQSAARKILAARLEGAIDDDGRLTDKGLAIVEEVGR